MRWNLSGLGLSIAVLVSCVISSSAQPASSTSPSEDAASGAMMLDLSPFFWERFVTSERTNMEMVSVSGRQIFDGLPFQVDGRACLSGIALANQRHKAMSSYPDIVGIEVGRAFDELHLLHATQFTDREQEVVAKARLNYADGTHHEIPLAYGVHVRDWQRMHSEEKEIYTDPDTKVVWRGPGVARYKSTTRISKTRLLNPFPHKIVSTIDFVSTGRVASYDIAAATVAKSDPTRPVTPPVPIDRPDRVFDASLLVRIIDEAGEPIEGVVVEPNISVGGSPSATVSTPLYTDREGMGLVRYPKAESSCMYFVTYKQGWQRAQEDPWVRLRDTSKEIILTIRMVRDPALLATAESARPNALGQAAATSSATNNNITRTAAVASPVGGTTTPHFTPHPVLMIGFPPGSNVRIEASDNLAAKVWDSVTVITNLPASPYPFICGDDCPHSTQRFYRAVMLP